MAPHKDDTHGDETPVYKPRILIIGAGSRGHAYAEAIVDSNLGIVAAIAEPIDYKRRQFGAQYVWQHQSGPMIGQEFASWEDYVRYENERRSDQSSNLNARSPHIDVAYVCVLDEQHVSVVTALAPFGLHIMCEKPLATTLKDCVDMYTAMLPAPDQNPSTIFGIGHVLRYSPHNMLLRELVREKEVIGDILSVEHTEPVGWWHYSHSYVRNRKPKAAGSSTNCVSCPIQTECLYSAPKIYYDSQLAKGNVKWPVNVVNPEIESCYTKQGPEAAKSLLFSSLTEDFDPHTPLEKRLSRPWFGRCVWESDNDVCDDQFVTITWNDQQIDDDPSKMLNAKTATFHMIAGTEKQCERRGRIYGHKGEIEYDGTTIRVFDFATGSTKVYNPPRAKGGHGGGDGGLVRQFLQAVIAAETKTMTTAAAQVHHLGCTLEEIIRSHAMVFAAEEARKERKVVDWPSWWSQNVHRAVVSVGDHA